MKPYAFQPLVRARFQPPVSTVVARPFRFNPSVVRPAEVKSTQPAVNVLKVENGYELKLAVPGVPKNQIRIEMIEDQLVISSTNSTEEQPKLIRQEFDFGNFKRSFTLHKNADTANLKASFDQGILTISIPDKEPETRKIEIV